MKIIVSGSLAYDRIMNFEGYFSEHIIPQKIHSLNICFQVDGIKERFGGTAGNIAYALTLMGEHPLISATIGHDYQRYFDWLARNEISTKHIKIVENDFTASAYITTDRADNQITGFHPGAMKYSSSLDFGKLEPQDSLVIVSPGNMEDMIHYPELCKSRGIDYIFDPGQSLPMWSPPELVQSLTGARILISNDYELEMIMQKTGLSQEDLLGLCRNIIVTRGEHGSRVFTSDNEASIPAAKPLKVVDPTGAGDSFRGGLVSGLVRGLDIRDCARMGSVCASFCVEVYGTQEYRFSSVEFKRRMNDFIELP